MSESLASILTIVPGDTLTLLARPIDGGLEGTDVRVTGILSGAFEEELRRAIVLDLSLAQRLLRMEGRATEICSGSVRSVPRMQSPPTCEPASRTAA